MSLIVDGQETPFRTKLALSIAWVFSWPLTYFGMKSLSASLASGSITAFSRRNEYEFTQSTDPTGFWVAWWALGLMVLIGTAILAFGLYKIARFFLART
jgi:hypothetical protein